MGSFHLFAALSPLPAPSLVPLDFPPFSLPIPLCWEKHTHTQLLLAKACAGRKQTLNSPGLPRGDPRPAPTPGGYPGPPRTRSPAPPPSRSEPPRACEPGPLNATACIPAGPLPRRPAANGAISGSPNRSSFLAWGVAGGGGPQSWGCSLPGAPVALATGYLIFL